MAKQSHTLEEKKVIVDQVERYQETNDVTVREACSASDISTANYYSYKRQLIDKDLYSKSPGDDKQIEIFQVTSDDIKAAKEEIRKEVKEKLPKRKINDDLQNGLMKRMERMERITKAQQQMIRAQQEMINIQNEGEL